MDYFDDEGHLTNYAFKQLINGESDSLKRLEMAEHLDFCDRCIDIYTKKLMEPNLISPLESISKEVMSKLKTRTRRMFMNKYATIAIAASFAMILWNHGVFEINYERNTQFIIKTNAIITEKSQNLNRGLENIFFEIYNKIESGEVFR